MADKVFTISMDDVAVYQKELVEAEEQLAEINVSDVPTWSAKVGEYKAMTYQEYVDKYGAEVMTWSNQPTPLNPPSVAPAGDWVFFDDPPSPANKTFTAYSGALPKAIDHYGKFVDSHSNTIEFIDDTPKAKFTPTIELPPIEAAPALTVADIDAVVTKDHNGNCIKVVCTSKKWPGMSKTYDMNPTDLIKVKGDDWFINLYKEDALYLAEAKVIDSSLGWVGPPPVDHQLISKAFAAMEGHLPSGLALVEHPELEVLEFTAVDQIAGDAKLEQYDSWSTMLFRPECAVCATWDDLTNKNADTGAWYCESCVDELFTYCTNYSCEKLVEVGATETFCEWCSDHYCTWHMQEWWFAIGTIYLCNTCSEEVRCCQQCDVGMGADDYCWCEACDGHFCGTHFNYDEDMCNGCAGPSYGIDKTAPWIERGMVLEIPDSIESWEDIWSFDPKEHDPVVAAAEFYICQGIKGNVLAPGDRDLEIYQLEAQAYIDELVEEFDPAFRAYLDMAVGGELRYHRASQNNGGGLREGREDSWSAWNYIRAAVGPQALVDAAAMFEQIGDGGIGGKPWADIAMTLHARVTNQINPELFLDRVFSLQHNGGCALNKLMWKLAPSNKFGMWGVQAINNFVGPAHSGLRPCFDELLECAGPKVRELWGAYVRAAQKVRRLHRMPPAMLHVRPLPDQFGTVRAWTSGATHCPNVTALDARVLLCSLPAHDRRVVGKKQSGPYGSKSGWRHSTFTMIFGNWIGELRLCPPESPTMRTADKMRNNAKFWARMNSRGLSNAAIEAVRAGPLPELTMYHHGLLEEPPLRELARCL